MDRRTFLLTGVGGVSVTGAMAGCLGDSGYGNDASSNSIAGESGSESNDRATEADTDPDVDDWVDFDSVDEALIERVEAIDLEAVATGNGDGDEDENGDGEPDLDQIIDEYDHDGVHDLWLVNESDAVLEATVTIDRNGETALEGTLALPADAALVVVLAEEGTYETTVAAESAGTTRETTTTVTPRASCAVSRTILSFGDGGSVGTHTESRC